MGATGMSLEDVILVGYVTGLALVVEVVVALLVAECWAAWRDWRRRRYP